MVGIMTDLKYEIKHLNEDVKLIHDHLEHLNTHSRICNELVKESNMREANELFKHLQEIDKLIHEVQNHIMHIGNHIDQNSTFISEKEILDIEDLKIDAAHTTIDLKDVHTHIEHLISHTEMCQNILVPTAEEELGEIKVHLEEIDEKAHELLNHIQNIRGGISTKYSEFIWSIPDGFDEYLKPGYLIDSNDKFIREMALKIVDGCESIDNAITNILYFVRDFIGFPANDDQTMQSASRTLSNTAGCGIDKSLLVSALARGVSVPVRLRFIKTTPEIWKFEHILKESNLPKIQEIISISIPEFYKDNKWVNAMEILASDYDVAHLHEDFLNLGIKPLDQNLDPNKWHPLPINDQMEGDHVIDPAEYLKSKNYSAPPFEINRLLFAGFIYTGQI
jgi:hypothetical protein